MRLSQLLAFNAIVAAVFGVPAVLVPGVLFSIYGMRSDAAGQFALQLFGSTLIAEAIITWGLRQVGPGSTRQTLTLALFVEALIGFATALLAQLGGVMNSIGWIVVALPIIFTVGYGYYRFIRPEE